MITKLSNSGQILILSTGNFSATAFLYEINGFSNCSHFLHMHNGDTDWGSQYSINSQFGHPTEPPQIMHLRSSLSFYLEQS